MRIRCRSKATFDDVWALLERQATLLAQHPHRQWYVEVTGDIGEEDLKAPPRPSEPYPVRHLHVLTVPVVEVAAP